MARRTASSQSSTAPSPMSAASRKKLHERVAKLEQPLVRFASEFCAFDTSNPPGRQYKACCEFLKAKLDALGMTTKLYRVPKAEQAKLVPGLDDWPRYNLVGRWDVGAAKTLHFTGHYDVVPATSGWKTDPFSPVVKAGKLIARGAADMKGSNTCAIFAVQAMMQAGITPPWNIELSFTADEETGGKAGLGWLVHQQHIHPDAAVLCEGGGRQSVGIAHRGVLWTQITVHGTAGHASNPPGGVNAFEKANLVIDELNRTAQTYRHKRSAYISDLPIGRHPTMMIGGVAGTGDGAKINTIPDRFSFSIDRRILPEEKITDVKAEIREAIRRAKKRDRKLKVEVSFLLEVEPGVISSKEMICKVARKAVRQVRRKPAYPRISRGFNDMHYLTNDAKVPTIGYGALGYHTHGDNEYVLIRDLLRATRTYLEIAMTLPADTP